MTYTSRPILSSPLGSPSPSDSCQPLKTPASPLSSPSSRVNGSSGYFNNSIMCHNANSNTRYGVGTTATSSPAHPLSHSTSFVNFNPNLNESSVLTKTFSQSESTVSLNYPKKAGPRGKLDEWYRAWSGASIGDSGVDDRHVKLPRLGYLDGLKFLAAWIMLNGTLFDAVIPGDQYMAIQRNSPLFIFRSTGLAITFFLLLLGRSIITPLWDVPTVTPRAIITGTPSVSWARLTRAMLFRPTRFFLPVIAIASLHWGLGATGKLAQANSVGMDEPYWGLISSFSGLATLVFDLFTYYEQDTRAGSTFGANLWTVPWFFQSSYAVYVIHFMLGDLSSNRYWVYTILGVFSWCTYNFFFVAILGLLITDLHSHGVFQHIRTVWSSRARLGFQVTLVTIALVTQWVPIIRDNINAGMAVLNVAHHGELTFCDSIFAFCLLYAVETCGLAQELLGSVGMRCLGQLSAGIYLLAPAIVYAVVPPVATALHENGTSLATTLFVSWVVLCGCGLVLAVVFHFLVELPSKVIGELICDGIEGMSNREGCA